MGSNQASAAEKRFGVASSLPSKEKSDPSTAFERSGWVRVFTFPSDPTKQNSYVVGTVELRARIEVQDTDGMIRRSVLFQEVLALIATATNPHNWPPSTMQTYWFGRFTDENESVPHVIAVRSSTAP
ncbi:hypothetical protein BBJ28_00008252 [Nothophytophthora sp. Chile5]|nr:hypothetical protein BBJ28_00008252 [Nothophytophthora sp. Chile5]